MRQVRLLTKFRDTPGKNAPRKKPGEILEVKDEVAEQYIRDGIATPVDVVYVKGNPPKETK